jgi:hypothetical protein
LQFLNPHTSKEQKHIYIFLKAKHSLKHGITINGHLNHPTSICGKADYSNLEVLSQEVNELDTRREISH